MLNPKDPEFTQNLEALKKELELVYPISGGSEDLKLTSEKRKLWIAAWTNFFETILGNISNQEFLDSFSILYYLICDGFQRGLNGEEQSLLINALCKNRSVTIIHLYGIELQLSRLAILLRNNSTITELNSQYMMQTSIAERWGNLSEEWENFASVKYRDEWKNLAEALAQNRTIQKLNLGYHLITDTFLQFLTDNLVNHPSLTELDLSRIPLSEKGMDNLLKLLKNNPGIINVNLNKCIGSLEVLSKINPFIASNPSLQVLDITDSDINLGESYVGKEFCEALQQNTHLKALSLNSHDLCICERTSLDNRDERNRDKEQDSVLEKPKLSQFNQKFFLYILLDTMKTQRSITTLNLFSVTLHEQEIWQIADILKENRVLSSLFLVDCWDYDEFSENPKFMKIICEALKANRTLKELHVPSILGTEGYIDSLMEINRSLHTFIGHQQNDPQERILRLYTNTWKGIQKQLDANKPAAKALERDQVSNGLSSASFSSSLMHLIFDFIGCNDEPIFERQNSSFECESLPYSIYTKPNPDALKKTFLRRYP